MTKLRAQYDGKVLIPTEPVNLPTGRVLEVEVRDVDESASLAAAIAQLPVVPPEDVAELQQIIRQSRLPARNRDVFDPSRDQ